MGTRKIIFLIFLYGKLLFLVSALSKKGKTYIHHYFLCENALHIVLTDFRVVKVNWNFFQERWDHDTAWLVATLTWWKIYAVVNSCHHHTPRRYLLSASWWQLTTLCFPLRFSAYQGDNSMRHVTQKVNLVFLPFLSFYGSSLIQILTVDDYMCWLCFHFYKSRIW